MGFSLFTGLRPLASGDLVCCSASVRRQLSKTCEMIVTGTGRDWSIVFKTKTGPRNYETQVLEPSGATALGQALIEGARQAAHSPQPANGA